MNIRPEVITDHDAIRHVNRKADISIFAVSTFDTDYLLVKRAELKRAVDALRQHEHPVQNQ